ncbi:MAG: aminotransferase class I/II-fold pyridoxal phosphate-dependent enzyme [Gammaproteobacteria bacterium]|nr:aminotransferase class I/II-fold pyridoxal phosphate-dependent enzyme [Gammaproteobacteria bacterium]
MRFSSLTQRIGGEGARAWEIHNRAMKRARGGEDVILLSIGDPDFDTPPPIVDSCVASLRAGHTHYTAISGEPALRAAIARHHAAITGTPCTPDRVVVFHGAQNALYSAAMCLLDRDDDVIVPEPMYVTYEAVVGASGARMVSVPCPREAGFHLDLDALAAAVTPQTRAILLNTPNNPTGTVLTAAELTAVANLCRRHDLWLISDEVYATLTFEREHISPCALPGMAERTVTVNSLSKSHAMTGWRVGWTVSPPELTPHLGNLALCMHYGCPGFIQDAAAAGLDNEPAEIAAMKAELKARRDLVCTRLGSVPGLECLKPDAGMFVMLDVRGTGITAFEFASGLLEAHRVSLLPADAFGQSARGHLRIGLCSSQDMLAEACQRIVRHTEAVMRR